MDMKVNIELIKSERNKRAWSQEHLARVAGLGVRTIQRIENSGSASLESVKALASVLDLEIARLQVTADPATRASPTVAPRRVGLASLIAAVMLMLGVIAVRTSLAQTVMLDYTVSVELQEAENNALEAVSMGHELISKGQTAIILLDQLKLEVTPTIQQDGVQIMLAVKVFENVDGEYSLKAEPKVVTADNQEATIRSGSSTGKLLSIFMTPSIQ